MKLMSVKKENEVQRLIKDYKLGAKPYEVKESAVMLIAGVLPLTTLCVVSSNVDVVYGIILSTFSMLPSFMLIDYAGFKATQKRCGKQRIADNYYENKDYANFNVKDLHECDKNRADAVELAEKLTKLKALKIRRDARDISSYDYEEGIKSL